MSFKYPQRLVGCLVAVALLFSFSAPLAAIESNAREAILMDFDTGAVLFEKDADFSMPPASMSKIMTTFMVFEALRDGRVSMETLLPVSEKAWRMGGSKMFVDVDTEVSVADLLRGVIVQSGNDACIVLAEGLAGSEEAFAALMTRRATEIGLKNSRFENATGWPDPDHRTTARDLALLARIIIRDHGDYYPIFAEREFFWSDIRQGNRNPLLYKNIGADGLKTGHTEEAGYGLTASAVQDGRRLILVVNGLGSVKERASEATKLLTWGFRQFDNYKLLAAGETVEEAPVWLGDAARVPLVVRDPVVVTLERSGRKDMRAVVRYDSPIPAPITEGSKLAELSVSAPGMAVPLTVPLYAGADVPRLGPFGRIFGSIKFLIFGAP